MIIIMYIYVAQQGFPQRHMSMGQTQVEISMFKSLLFLENSPFSPETLCPNV